MPWITCVGQSIMQATSGMDQCICVHVMLAYVIASSRGVTPVHSAGDVVRMYHQFHLQVWFLPPPSGVTTQAWHLLAIFLGTIVGIITQPLPLGAVAMLGLGATMLTKTLTFAAAFSAFASEIP